MSHRHPQRTGDDGGDGRSRWTIAISAIPSTHIPNAAMAVESGATLVVMASVIRIAPLPLLTDVGERRDDGGRTQHRRHAHGQQ